MTLGKVRSLDGSLTGYDKGAGFNSLNLTQLDVSENSIETLDLTALGKLESVQCSKNKLSELSLNGKSLVSLIAGNNSEYLFPVPPHKKGPANVGRLDAL
uniref:Uncharacterized protein n=1 Tax=Timema bartmani TaxID=61472 RepID=A0A7R9EWQ7_9NEOP|nr:unnamed protein product [Timema bartmani]